MRKTHTRQQGSLTLEILIALSLLVTALVGATLVVHGAYQTSTSISHAYGEKSAAHQTLEELTASLKKDWYTEQPPVHISDNYTLSSYIEDISSCTKKISVTAQYSADASMPSETLSSFVGSLDEARRRGGTCDPAPLLDTWDTPEILGSVALPQGGSTGIALHAQGTTRYAYVTATSTHVLDADFFVLDVTDVSNPHIVMSLDTGNGLTGLVRGGEYIYALNNDNTEQLHVIDVTNPQQPVLIAHSSLPNLPSTCSATTTPCYAGRSIFYYDGTIYIGTSYIAFGSTPLHHHEFHVFCVSNTSVAGCSPTNPTWQGSLNVNHHVNDIFVQGRYAYLATSDTEGEMMIVDITDPAHMVHPDDTDTRFNARTIAGNESTENGTSVFVLGPYTYLGRERVNNALERDFYILDTRTPDDITTVSSMRLGLSTRTAVSDIIVHDSRAFIGTTDVTHPLLIFDSSDKENPLLQNSCTILSRPIPYLAYADDFLFAMEDGAAVAIIADSSSSCTSL